MWIYRTFTLVFVVQLIAIGTCVTEHSRRVRPVTTSGQELPDTGRLRLHRVWLGPHPLQIQRGADDQVFGLFKWVIARFFRLNFDNTLSFGNLKKKFFCLEIQKPHHMWQPDPCIRTEWCVNSLSLDWSMTYWQVSWLTREVTNSLSI